MRTRVRLAAERLRAITASADDGFSLVEALVAIILLGLLAAAVADPLVTALHLTRANRMRVVAANLASRQIELTRALNTTAIPSGQKSWTVPVDDTTFTVTQTAEYVPRNSTSSTCDSPQDSQLGYKRVTVNVTWPQMDGVKPVRSDTLKTLGVVGLDPTKGSLAVSVKDRNGVGLGGQTVTLAPTGDSQLTGDNGCAVFVDLTAGSNYSVAVNTPGYVDTNMSQNSVKGPLTVLAATISKASIDYDRAAGLGLSYVGPPKYTPANVLPAGYAPPSTPFPITLRSTLFGNLTKAFPDCGSAGAVAGSCATGNPRSISPLYPSAQGYGAWAGGCADAAPPTPTPIAVTPGATTAGTVALAAVQVTVSGGNGAVPVWAVHPPDSASCPAGEAYRVGVNSGVIKTALPYGKWYFEVAASAYTPSGAEPAATLAATDTVPAAVVVAG